MGRLYPKQRNIFRLSFYQNILILCISDFLIPKNRFKFVIKFSDLKNA